MAALVAAIAATCAVMSAAWRPGMRPHGGRMQAVPFSAPAMTIVLPPRLMAAHPATLALFGPDGKLVPDVSVDLSDGESVKTDATGRAHFTVPAKGTFLLARSEGTTVAALIDPAAGASEPKAVALPPIVSLRENIWMCAPGLQGDATADTVKIDGRTALVLAASPQCVVALPPPRTMPGPASISLQAPGVQWNASIKLVALDFQPPRPALQPGHKGKLAVRVRGSGEKLNLVVENTAPDVLQFRRGGVQQVRTSGGANNVAEIEVVAQRSGDFSFRARIIPPANPEMAARYLMAAAPYAGRAVRRRLEKLAHRLERRPRDVAGEREEITQILNQAAPGDFSTLLSAAYSAL